MASHFDKSHLVFYIYAVPFTAFYQAEYVNISCFVLCLCIHYFRIHKTFISALWAANGALSTPTPQLVKNININLMFEDEDEEEDEEEDCDGPLFSPVLLFPAFAHYKVTVNNGAHHICFWDKCGTVLQLQVALLPQSPCMTIFH